MPHELDKILIYSSQLNFRDQIEALHLKLKRKARFGGSDEEPVWEIIRKVSEKGDEAVAEYTEKYDHVKLKPEQFRISKVELERARKAVDADLMKSIHQAIKNVREYQKEIFIANKKDNQHPGINIHLLEESVFVFLGHLLRCHRPL